MDKGFCSKLFHKKRKGGAGGFEKVCMCEYECINEPHR